MTEIVIPFKTGAARFRKVGKRNALAISIINVAVYMEKEAGRITALTIAIGSAGPTALRAFHTEELLRAWKRPDSEENGSLFMKKLPLPCRRIFHRLMIFEQQEVIEKLWQTMWYCSL